VKYTDCQKVIGVHIDNHLTFKRHIKNVHNKIASRIHLLRRLKEYLPIYARKLFYNSYILPLMEYACTVWSCCNCQESIKSLYKLQVRAARIIIDANMDIESVEVLKSIKWVSIVDRIHFHKSKLMYKTMNNLGPSYMTNTFKHCNDVHIYTLRSTTDDKLFIPQANSEYFKRSLSYSGAVIWNNLSSYVKNATNINMFKDRYWKSYHINH
jgi:hypothetical protein